MEKTFKFKQEDIVKNVDISSAQKHFDLKFDQFGPYSLNYSRNGRHLLIGGKKGHIGAFDWQSGKLSCEIHLGETVRDVQCVFILPPVFPKRCSWPLNLLFSLLITKVASQ